MHLSALLQSELCTVLDMHSFLGEAKRALGYLPRLCDMTPSLKFAYDAEEFGSR